MRDVHSSWHIADVNGERATYWRQSRGLFVKNIVVIIYYNHHQSFTGGAYAKGPNQ